MLWVDVCIALKTDGRSQMESFGYGLRVFPAQFKSSFSAHAFGTTANLKVDFWGTSYIPLVYAPVLCQDQPGSVATSL